MSTRDVEQHNTMQAFSFNARAFILSGKSGARWEVSAHSSVYDNAVTVVLLKDAVIVHSTCVAKDMADYIDALIALEGK